MYSHWMPSLLWLFISLVLLKKNSLFMMILQQFWQWLLPMLPPPPTPATLTRRGRLSWEMSSVWSGWKTRIRLINYSKNNHTFLLFKHKIHCNNVSLILLLYLYNDNLLILFVKMIDIFGTILIYTSKRSNGWKGWIDCV